MQEAPLKSYTSIILGLIIFTFLGCNRNLRSDQSKLELTDTERMEAREIVTTVCQNCHHPTAAPDNRLAPPLEIAKRNYLASSSSKADFVDQFTRFIIAPTQEEAKLHSDVEEFGMMDPLGYSEEQIRAVAIFVYETDLEKPDWLD